MNEFLNRVLLRGMDFVLVTLAVIALLVACAILVVIITLAVTVNWFALILAVPVVLFALLMIKLIGKEL